MDSSNQTAARNDIMLQIANQAASVRRTFEDSKSNKKLAVHSATAAAAQHMASLNRKRKFENHLVRRVAGKSVDQRAAASEYWKRTSRTFHSPIASFTRPCEKVNRQQVVSASNAPTAIPPTTRVTVKKEPQAPRVSDGIVLKACPEDITVTYNDVVCGKGKTTSSLVGNQRYRVWIDLHKEAFSEAQHDEDRLKIASSIVDAVVTTSVPRGRFLSLDIHTGLWYDVGYQRAVGITLEKLESETQGAMDRTKQFKQMCAYTPLAKRASAPRVYTSRAA